MIAYLISNIALVVSIIAIVAFFYYEYAGLFRRSYSRLISGCLILDQIGLIHRLIIIQFAPPNTQYLLDSINLNFIILEAHLSGLCLVLINIQTLTLFSALNDRITTTKIKILYVLNVSIYLGGALVQIVQTYKSELAPIMEGFILIETVSAVSLDCFTSIFLSLILYRKLNSLDSKNGKVKHEIAALIGGNILALCNSWAAFLLLFYINVTTQADDTKLFLFATQYSLVALHSIILAAMFLKYKRVALLKKEDVSIQSKKITFKKLLLQQGNSLRTGEAATILATQLKRD
ncbi:hypothetical protein HDV06_006844 [Boothiomyces sp. JEL0866]|nr:hypothetical protein HDV06_006844 [Boothiomyces sp. JEL0866]